MQTLSLKNSQSAQKNLADVVNKNDSGFNPAVNGSAASAEKTPFQMELTRQVQAKKQPVQPVQAKAVNTQNKVTQNATARPSSAHQKTAADDNSAVNNRQDLTGNTKAEQAADSGARQPMDSSAILQALQSMDQLAEANLLGDAKETKALQQEELIVSPDGSNVALLAGASLMAPSLVTPAVTQSDEAVMLAGEQGNPSADKNLQAALLTGHEFSSKTAATVPGDANLASKNLNQTAEGDKSFGAAVTEQDSAQPRLLDKAIENQSNMMVREDTQLNKTVTMALNDIANKEAAAIQAATAQTQTTQLSGTLASQQLASANTINVYPGKTGWDQAISQKVVWMVGAGEQTASLTLNPPDLGPLKVVIHVHNDQADTTFISDNDEVRQALESGLSNLRDKMSESGIQLGQTNVSTSSQSQQNFQQAAQGRAIGQSAGQANAPQVEVATKTVSRVSVANGLVDTFA